MKKSISYKQLMVNPENYRFDPVDNQDEAIDLMLEEKGDEIVNLAKHILEKGLDQGRDTRVLSYGKNMYLVLDGNRRTTALKCLHNPQLVKDAGLRRRFEDLLKGGKNPVEIVNCIVYKTEEEASEWIRLDHTGKNNGVGQDSWGPAEQERFDFKFGGKLSPATQLFDLYTKKSRKKLKTKDIKITTINRILANPEARSYLGVDVNKGAIQLTTIEDEVVRRLDILFTKIIADNVPVRKVYKAPLAVKFMKDLFGTKPVSTSSSPTPPKNASIPHTPAKKALPKSTSRNRLIPSDCILTIKPQKINDIYLELRDDLVLDNSPHATPNAVGVLFRVFMEVSLDYYSEKERGKPFSPNDTVSQKIDAVTQYLEDNRIATKKQLGPMRAVAHSSRDVLHVQRFHEYVHSSTIQPDPATLKTKWNNLQEFFLILWEDLEKKGK